MSDGKTPKRPRAPKAKKPPKPPNPFGEVVRLRALRDYVATSGFVDADNAWGLVYRLLLSMDRRTKLAHVYDANHMQPGGSFHSRAVRFTTLLAKEWMIEPSALGAEVDRMFGACVVEYLAQREEGAANAQPVSDEEASSFVEDVRALLVERLATPSAEATALAVEIERRAEDYFTIGQKRQNVRGEGFEDVLGHLLREVARVPAKQLRLRTPANALPGFKPPLPSAGKAKDKVPKPDLALLTPEAHATLWLVTAKWSLRQDRLDQFGQEFTYYQGHQSQRVEAEYLLVTNEMDVARLRDVLAPPPGAGGFHFRRVYHVNAELLEQMHEEKFAPLRIYRKEGRLLSLRDFLIHARTQFAT